MVLLTTSCLHDQNIIVPVYLYLYYISKSPFANQNTPSRGQLGSIFGKKDIPSLIIHSEEKLS